MSRSLSFRTLGCLCSPATVFLQQDSDIPANQDVACISVDVHVPELTETQQPRPRDVLLIVDVSASMSSVISDVQQTVASVIEIMKSSGTADTDRIAIVTFGSEGVLRWPLTFVSHINNISEITNLIAADGSTNLSQGLEVAFNHCIENAPSQPTTTLFLLLTDGQPNQGIQDSAEIVEMVSRKGAELCYPNLAMLACLGFTTDHNSNLLVSLTTSLPGQGSYYFLRTQEDIPVSVGDTIVSASTSMFHINVSCLVRSPGNWQCLEFASGRATTLDPMVTNATALSNPCKSTISRINCGQTFNVIFVCFDPTQPTPPELEVSVCVDWSPTASAVTTDVSQTVVITRTTTPPIHILTHVLRLSSAMLLEKAISPASTSAIIPSVELTMAQITQAMELVRAVEGNEVIQDERLLQQFEKDIGELFQRLDESTRVSSTPSWAMARDFSPKQFNEVEQSVQLKIEFQMQFAQFALSHRSQQPVGTASALRHAYSTRQHTLMQSRMLKAQRQLVNKNPGSSFSCKDEITASKKAAETYKCFVLQTDFTECEIGIGLYVLPRTARERRKGLLPTCELTNDYLSSIAFNEGVRIQITRGTTLLNRDEALPEDVHDESTDTVQHKALTSSLRGCINAWLPLYINKEHWNRVSPLAPASFSLIATQFNDLFQPDHALRVCARLMCATVVRFTVHDGGQVSDRALQMYCDVHRVFLAMAEDHPEIVARAESVLQDFITQPTMRTRAVVPDLGDMMQYLAITSKYDWNDIKVYYFQEMFRRQALRLPRLQPTLITSSEDIVTHWKQHNPSFGTVTLFNLGFLKAVARRQPYVEGVKASYDVHCGLQNDAIARLKKPIAKFRKFNFLDLANELLAGVNDSAIPAALCTPLKPDDLANLFLWAFANKDADATNTPVDLQALESRHTVLHEWMEMHTLHVQALQAEPTPAIAELPFFQKRQDSPDAKAMGPFLEQLKVSPGGMNPQPSDCNEVEHCICDCPKCRPIRMQQKYEEKVKQQSETAPCKVCIRGLHKNTDREAFATELTAAWPNEAIVSVTVPMHARQHKCRGFAFVEFRSRELAAQALKTWQDHGGVTKEDGVRLSNVVGDGPFEFEMTKLEIRNGRNTKTSQTQPDVENV
eukprot:c11577_g1_i1.p1 GENE.c11577_g1_i1~~c11577_g1_i1.p1  ORF type:complete len:1125 (-),score=248.58 c11577_g1_i1:249-3623(-)